MTKTIPTGPKTSTVSPAVSDRMRRVRRSNTGLERAVRQILRDLGARYRVCSPGLPGRPDIANRSHQWAVFVHGCFWHGHARCGLATIPKTNATFWAAKLAANRQRDAAKARALRSLGFRVLVVWQCELRNYRRLERRLKDLL
jgi:DNA mismatch endonuclease (patch repair protein)